ncbi:hypothetical protein PTKIN_Ptkin12aG0004900 [Pterospermum kingtungense]
MKLHAAVELLFGRNHAQIRKSPKIVLLIIIFATLVFLTIIPVLCPLLGYPLYLLKNSLYSKPAMSTYDSFQASTSTLRISEADNQSCDLFSGEWVPNPDAPYYTNTTCRAIQELQNCMKYGRPDTEFMKWKWKPYGCELPVFDPVQFLEIVRGKSLAFIGDSVSRNHMQSLICLLSRVEYPEDVSFTPNERFKRWKYTTYNFTIASFWTTHLIKSIKREANGPIQNSIFDLYLDEFDEQWTTHIEEFDYLIISGGHWFYRNLVFYENHQVVGCHSCNMENVTDLTKFYGYRRAFRTALRAINSLDNFKGMTFLRTFAPSHFENGWWNHGGNCLRTRPFTSNETVLDGANLELYMIQVEEFRVAEREGRNKGKIFKLIDTTQAMLLRPDGHPSRYGHWPRENVTMYNDCAHWCLPGPIDTWNDFLLQMLKMEGARTSQ